MWLRANARRTTAAEYRERLADAGIDATLQEGVPDALRLTEPRPVDDLPGFSSEEICKILEVSSTNLGVMLFRLRNRVRECLEAKWAA